VCLVEVGGEVGRGVFCTVGGGNWRGVCLVQYSGELDSVVSCTVQRGNWKCDFKFVTSKVVFYCINKNSKIFRITTERFM